jgi:transposase-like protein
MEHKLNQPTRYPASVKESLIAKALAPNAPSVVELAKEHNIPYQTYYNWMRMIKKDKQINGSLRPQDKSAQQKLQAVFDTHGMTEVEIGAYCRAQGIYPNHLDAWKQQALQGLDPVKPQKNKAENIQVQKEVKELKRDLHRKDKALAEVSALLILKKKADLLWGEPEGA